MQRASHRRNIPLFIAFRVLFNARWYYPVLAVLFLDLGLSVEQYALLNVAWAAAIVGLEVPSGALADHIGRKKMIVFASLLMVVEMAVFAFAPRGNPTLLFSLFLVNRLLSGAAEASASGADEALAYDSLVADEREKEWPQVLDRVMRWQSAAFFITMMLGAAVYDPVFLGKAAGTLGIDLNISKDIAIRLPLFLTLANAVLALAVSLRFKEPPVKADEHEPSAGGPWKTTLLAGKWIWATPLAFSIILTGLCFDSIIRLFMTFEATYFRVIHLPTASFGVLAAGLSLLGFVVPLLAKAMVKRWRMRTNFIVLAGVVFAGFAGAAFVTPWWGLVWTIPLGMAMSFTQFFVSHYLNGLVTDSRRRATILSFRGLAFNLGYGGVGLMFAALTAWLGRRSPGASPDTVFGESLAWLPWYFLATMALLAVAAAIRHRRA